MGCDHRDAQCGLVEIREDAEGECVSADGTMICLAKMLEEERETHDIGMT
jgi:hypothetical protein